MLRLTPGSYQKIISKSIQVFHSWFFKILDKVWSLRLFNGDFIYKINFRTYLKPVIYYSHLGSNYKSCAFCANLKRTNCHAHCLKCSLGYYVQCSPLLPGLMYYDKKNPDEYNNLSIPWLYKKTCKKFQRLQLWNYLRNFTIPFSWITIYNYEVLEGLVFGCSLQERPCYICASIDYSIYKSCLNREDFEKNTPCQRISRVVEAIFQNSIANIPL